MYIQEGWKSGGMSACILIDLGMRLIVFPLFFSPAFQLADSSLESRRNERNSWRRAVRERIAPQWVRLPGRKLVGSLVGYRLSCAMRATAAQSVFVSALAVWVSSVHVRAPMQEDGEERSVHPNYHEFSRK